MEDDNKMPKIEMDITMPMPELKVVNNGEPDKLVAEMYKFIDRNGEIGYGSLKKKFKQH